MNFKILASLARSGALALCLAAGCLIPGASQAGVAAAEIEQMIEQRLQNYQYIAPVLAENPDVRAKMLSAGRAAYERGGRAALNQVIDVEAMELAARESLMRLPSTSDAAAKEYMESFLVVLRNAENQPKYLCYALLSNATERHDAAVTRSTAAEQARFIAAMGNVITASRNNPQPVAKLTDHQAVLNQVVANLTAALGEGNVVLPGPEVQGEDQRKACRATIVLYEQILALPHGQSGPLLRALFGDA